MKKILFPLFIVVFISNVAFAQEKVESTTVILVRHAEKATDDPKDPTLTTSGIERAERLKELLKDDFEVKAVYSTPYKRTKLTAKPTADFFGIEIMEYGFSDPKGLAESWVNYPGGTVLVVGHSNTTPYFTNLLLGEEKYEKLDETEYGTIYIVRLTELGNAEVEIQNY